MGKIEESLTRDVGPYCDPQSHLKEVLATLIISICECGSNSPNTFPGDEMFESAAEETFTFIAKTAVNIFMFPIAYIL
jgi:hypothetical protein